MEQDEGAAMTLAASREDDGFRALVERHSHTIFRLAYRMTANEHDAEEVVQETFMRAFRSMAQFENRADIGTWLYRIGMNCSLDCLRSRQRRDTGKESIENLADRDSHALRASDPSPDRILLSAEIRQRVSAELAELTPKERAAFVLRHFEGRSIEEIARILDMRANAAKNTIFRAVKKLRKALGPEAGYAA
jgi:RNA polymerase sigma-70 factor, ECF subfamily